MVTSGVLAWSSVRNERVKPPRAGARAAKIARKPPKNPLSASRACPVDSAPMICFATWPSEPARPVSPAWRAGSSAVVNRVREPSNWTKNACCTSRWSPWSVGLSLAISCTNERAEGARFFSASLSLPASPENAAPIAVPTPWKASFRVAARPIRPVTSAGPVAASAYTAGSRLEIAVPAARIRLVHMEARLNSARPRKALKPSAN